MKLIILACLLAVCSAAPTSQSNENDSEEVPVVTLVSESDVRNDDGSSSWSYTLSDGTVRQESNSQKQVGDQIGNTNQGSVVYILPDGEKISLTWVADENGFQPEGDHLPTPPPIPEEIQKVLDSLPKLDE